MRLISITTAASLLEQSERTLRRRIADGSLQRAADEIGSNRAMLAFEAIRKQVAIPIAEEDWEVVAGADAGQAEAQNDLALLFLQHQKPQGAMYWLEAAAKQNHADAMHWLGRCYLDGSASGGGGLDRNENLGLMWLSRAAAHGHIISQEQMQDFREKVSAATVAEARTIGG